jgi:hypothetical protein
MVLRMAGRCELRGSGGSSCNSCSNRTRKSSNNSSCSSKNWRRCPGWGKLRYRSVIVSSRVRKLSAHSVTCRSSSSGVPSGSHAVSELSMASIFSLASVPRSKHVLKLRIDKSLNYEWLLLRWHTIESSEKQAVFIILNHINCEIMWHELKVL